MGRGFTRPVTTLFDSPMWDVFTTDFLFWIGYYCYPLISIPMWWMGRRWWDLRQARREQQSTVPYSPAGSPSVGTEKESL